MCHEIWMQYNLNVSENFLKTFHDLVSYQHVILPGWIVAPVLQLYFFRGEIWKNFLFKSVKMCFCGLKYNCDDACKLFHLFLFKWHVSLPTFSFRVWISNWNRRICFHIALFVPSFDHSISPAPGTKLFLVFQSTVWFGTIAILGAAHLLVFFSQTIWTQVAGKTFPITHTPNIFYFCMLSKIMMCSHS